MSISQTGAGPVTRHKPRVTFGVMRWLFYKSSGEQDEMAASYSRIPHGLSWRLAGRQGERRRGPAARRGHRGEEGSEAGKGRSQVAYTLSITRTSPGPRPNGCSSNTQMVLTHRDAKLAVRKAPMLDH